MAAREHLVVVLPGIGGSVLARPGRPDDLVWAAGFTDVGNILLRPERLSLGEHEHLDPVGLIATRTVFGVWTAVPGYDRLLRRLAALPGAVVDDGSPTGHDLHANVVAVPYDFRRSIVEAAQRLDDQIRARLAALWPGETGRPRVIIVAHSLGGLVARYWLADADNWPLCRSLITLGTPHRGAPKALDVLANGVDIKIGRIRRPVPVLREWPSVAELLPRYPAILTTSGTGQPELLRPHELPLRWLHGPATAAWTVHQRIEEGWEAMPRSGPELVPRIGYGHDTLRRARLDHTILTVDTAAPDIDQDGRLGQWAQDRGDGTVPADSGLPLELDRHSVDGLRVGQRHGPIADLDQIPVRLETYEGRPPQLPTRGAQRPIGLGLGVPEVALAGTTISVTARITGIDHDTTTVPVWARLDTPAGTADTRLEHDTATGTFRGELPATAPGLAKITVAAEAVPGGGDPQSEAWVEILDDDNLD